LAEEESSKFNNGVSLLHSGYCFFQLLGVKPNNRMGTIGQNKADAVVVDSIDNYKI